MNKTTIYRRWGTRAGLLADALIEGTGRQISLPDTGTVRGDLVAFALRVRDALVAPGSGGLMTALSAGGVHEELADVGRRYWKGGSRWCGRCLSVRSSGRNWLRTPISTL
ncbi:TetR-like C-terminal domain-containing protein [Nonomuraea rubra]|uniref:TetR-like C-terminal domain-containing protein n=1 Tax=Nonomuraea rubra TaxID=46180 RepID=UPI0033E48681